MTLKGKPVEPLLKRASGDDLERLHMGHSPKLQTILEEARKRFRAGEGIPHEEFWKIIEAEKAGSSKKQSTPRKRGFKG